MAYINGNEILFSAIINGIGEANQWCGEYVDGTGYKKDAIVSYEGNIYICIKDLDDMQDPTNAEYWEMLNEEAEEITLQEKTVTPAEAKQIITADSGKDGLSKVTVNPIPKEYIIPSGAKEITANGTYDVTDKASVTVAVAGEVLDTWNGTGIVIEAIEPEEPEEPEQPKTFTIGGATYTTENRLTWYEWCKNMDYNTDNFRCASTTSYVYEAESENVVTNANGIEVLGGQEITEGAEYLIKGGA